MDCPAQARQQSNVEIRLESLGLAFTIDEIEVLEVEQRPFDAVLDALSMSNAECQPRSRLVLDEKNYATRLNAALRQGWRISGDSPDFRAFFSAVAATANWRRGDAFVLERRFTCRGFAGYFEIRGRDGGDQLLCVWAPERWLKPYYVLIQFLAHRCMLRPVNWITWYPHFVDRLHWLFRYRCQGWSAVVAHIP